MFWKYEYNQSNINHSDNRLKIYKLDWLPGNGLAYYIAQNYVGYNLLTTTVVAKWTNKCWLMHHHYLKITEICLLSTSNFFTFIYFLFPDFLGLEQC